MTNATRIHYYLTQTGKLLPTPRQRKRMRKYSNKRYTFDPTDPK